MDRKRRWSALLAGTAALALVATACGNGDTVAPPASPTPPDTQPTTPPDETPDDDAAFQELVAAAEAEGALTFYSTDTEALTIKMVEAFEDAYPNVSVEWIRLPGAQGAQRFAAEAEAGSHVADVYLGGAGSVFVSFEENEWMTGPAQFDIPGYPWDYPTEFDLGHSAVINVKPWGMAINTDIVPLDEAPREWDDLIDERFADIILMSDPRGSAAYNNVWYAVLQEYGEEWFESLEALNPQWFESGVPATEALAAGEGGIQPAAVGGQIIGARERGAPLDLIVPTHTSGVEQSIGISLNAPHPNAAMLFVAFLMQREANLAVSDPGAFVYSPYDTTGLPTGYVSPDPSHNEHHEDFLRWFGLS